MSKGQLMMRIVAGGYLAYVGFDIARDVIVKRPDNYVVYLLISILFMILGAMWCIQALRKYIKHDYVDVWKENRAEEEKKDPKESSIEEAVSSKSNMEKAVSEENNSGKEE